MVVDELGSGRRGRRRLLDAGMSESDVLEIDQRVDALMDEAVEFAEDSPQPDVDEFLAEIAAA